MIRVGQVGIGQWGRNHFDILNNIEANGDIYLVGIYDSDTEKYKKLLGSDEEPYYNLPTLINNVDALIITTPTSTHYEIAKQALEAGKHVFIEKPVCDTVEQAEELAELANGHIVQIGHIERFNPAYQRLKKENFNPLVVHSRRCSNDPSRCNDVSVVMDLMIHDIDLALDLMRGEIAVSSVRGDRDKCMAMILFDGSGEAMLGANRRLNENKRIMAVRRKGGIVYELDFQERTLHKNGKILQEKTNDNLLELELKAFIDSVRENKPPLVGIEDAIKSLKVAKKIEELIDLQEVSQN